MAAQAAGGKVRIPGISGLRTSESSQYTTLHHINIYIYIIVVYIHGICIHICICLFPIQIFMVRPPVNYLQPAFCKCKRKKLLCVGGVVHPRVKKGNPQMAGVPYGFPFKPASQGYPQQKQTPLCDHHLSLILNGTKSLYVQQIKSSQAKATRDIHRYCACFSGQATQALYQRSRKNPCYMFVLYKY